MADKTSEPRASTSSVGITTVSLLLFAVIAVASFLPRTRVWGINHLAFYPVWLRIVALGGIGVTFLPQTARTLYGGLTAIVRGWISRPLWLQVTLALLLAIVLFAFPVATDLLGDGLLIKNGITDAIEIQKLSYVQGAASVIERERVYPGAVVLYFTAARLAVDYFHRSPDWGLWVQSSALGVLTLLFLVFVVRRLSIRNELRTWLVVLIAGSPAWVFFFGYIEVYPPLILLLTLYVVTALRALRGHGTLTWPWLWWALAFVVHVQALLFVPSLLFLAIMRRAGTKRPSLESLLPRVLFAGVLMVPLAAWLFTPLGDYYIPLRSTPLMYGLLSPAHLVDIMNELLLLLPALPVFLTATFLTRRDQQAPPDAKDKSRAWFLTPGERHFVYLIILPCLVYLLLFRPDLGMARDWDLFAMLSLGLIPWGLLVVTRYLRTRPKEAWRLVPAMAMTLVLCGAWIGIHTSWARSVDRFESILAYDQLDAAYVYGNLARVYHDAGQLPRAIEWMERSVASEGRPWHHIRLAKFYAEAGRREEAASLLQNAITRWPQDASVRLELLQHLAARGDYEEMLAQTQEGARLHSEEYTFHYYGGETLSMLRRFEEARVAYERALDQDPPAPIRQRIETQLRSIRSMQSNQP